MQAIANALAVRLQAMGLPTAYENAPFTPTDGVTYLAEAFLPAETVQVGMENGSSDSFTGIYQVTVMATRDGYKAEGHAKADAVVAHFARGTILPGVGVDVRIERAWKSPAILQGNRWAIPVSIRYRAFAK